MKKSNTFDKVFDFVFWGIIYLLPIIIFLICFCRYYFKFYDFDFDISSFLTVFGTESGFLSDIILSCLDFLGFESNFLTVYFCYFIFVTFSHIIIDIILFIPRYLIKILDGEKI